MKYLLAAALFFCSTSALFAQKNLVSYDDLNYLLHNNINKADTFFNAKGFRLMKKDIAKHTRKYNLTIPGGTYVNISMRTDGRRLYMEIETNEPEQYNLIYTSIADYVNKESTTVDVKAYNVKDLGNIYIISNDSNPYNPLRREYDIQIVSDKGITAYN
ncbi:hypothetical protein FFF34_005355 [Inquilinus sp. KBS0705]|nr:hypothetical protein FFF34_005355 [Inquilinus sp. KBS0705]